MYFNCCTETEWLFSSDPGWRQLAESACFERLVVVTLHRGHAYSSLDAVKEEVAGKAVELIQQGLPHGKQVIYMQQTVYIYTCTTHMQLLGVVGVDWVCRSGDRALLCPA